jgi:hypothetical protein
MAIWLLNFRQSHLDASVTNAFSNVFRFLLAADIAGVLTKKKGWAAGNFGAPETFKPLK